MQNVQRFCKVKGVRPTVACAESGVSSSFMTNVKKGQIPSVANVQKLATYLGVTTSQLLGEADPLAHTNDPGIMSDAEAILNEELIMRLCQLTPEELLRVDAFVQGLLAGH